MLETKPTSVFALSFKSGYDSMYRDQLSAYLKQVPKLKLSVPDSVSIVEPGSATPRSTYTNASKAAREAVEKSRGGGSARSMLHQHVAKMDWGP